MFTKYMRYLIRDQSFTVFSIVFMIAYWVQAGGMPYVAIRYPLVISVVACIFIIWNLVLSVIQFREKLREEGVENIKTDLSFGLNKQKWIIIAFTALYVFLIPIVGYVVMTSLYVFGLCLLLGIRKYVTIAVYTAVLVFSIYLIFGMWLHINIPTGFLI